MLKGLHQYHQFQQQDSLHGIRVDIKKIKSVLLVMEASLKKYDGHEQFLPLRNIFRKAGQIRQGEVMLQLLIAHNLEGLPVAPFEDGKEAEEEFRAEVPFYIELMTRHAEKIQHDVSDVRARDLEKFLRKQMKRVQSRLYPVLKPRELHNVRKSIKQIVYLSDLLDLLSQKKKRFFSRMEEAIGKLHDKEVLLEFLKTIPVQVDQTTVKTLRRACAADRKELEQRAAKFYASRPPLFFLILLFLVLFLLVLGGFLLLVLKVSPEQPVGLHGFHVLVEATGSLFNISQRAPQVVCSSRV